MDLLAGLKACGTRVVNSPRALECAVDKYLTTQRLALTGLPVPETIVCEPTKKGSGLFVWSLRSNQRDLTPFRSPPIDILKSHGIKIGGYLPCATFGIDANGQLYWTHPIGNSTTEFE